MKCTNRIKDVCFYTLLLNLFFFENNISAFMSHLTEREKANFDFEIFKLILINF